MYLKYDSTSKNLISSYGSPVVSPNSPNSSDKESVPASDNWVSEFSSPAWS